MFQFATPCLGMPPYLKLPCLCLPLFHLISSRFYVCVFYKKLMLQWQWRWPSCPHATYFSSLRMNSFFFVAITTHYFSFIPWLYVTPYISLLVFTLPPYLLDLTPCLYFILSLFYPLIFTILHVSPLFFDLCVFSLFSLDFSYLASHQNLKWALLHL
jgi:hypothetical protein